MHTEKETWSIEEGNRIIEKKSGKGIKALSDLKRAIYCFWFIDYAVRNSGTLHPMYDPNKNSVTKLLSFAKDNKCSRLGRMAELAKEEKIFCKVYYNNFDAACEDLRYFDKNGN